MHAAEKHEEEESLHLEVTCVKGRTAVGHRS
jgi:hypothetical protein